MAPKEAPVENEDDSRFVANNVFDRAGRSSVQSRGRDDDDDDDGDDGARTSYHRRTDVPKESGGTPPRSRPPEMESFLYSREQSNVEADVRGVQRASLVLFGVDLSGFDRTAQFFFCAGGVFFFTLVYGYLQELITIQIANRKYALTLASLQFVGYAFWSLVLDTLRPHKRALLRRRGLLTFLRTCLGNAVPLRLCAGLSLLKALDLGMSNMSLQYVNYPAKTLLKSSRVVVTMLLGIVISRKRYAPREYFAVALLVTGLVVFLDADHRSDAAVFHPAGVLLIVAALLCDGALSNYSELTMNRYNVGQDEFQLRLSSVAAVALAAAALVRGELFEGLRFFTVPGTYHETTTTTTPYSWTPAGKIVVMILFSSFGLFGASCAGAITKNYGAFYMSLTTTTRKASSLMVSFVLFPNRCTPQHAAGIFVFMTALTMKSLSAGAGHVGRGGGGEGHERTTTSKTPGAGDAPTSVLLEIPDGGDVDDDDDAKR